MLELTSFTKSEKFRFYNSAANELKWLIDRLTPYSADKKIKSRLDKLELRYYHAVFMAASYYA